MNALPDSVLYALETSRQRMDIRGTADPPAAVASILFGQSNASVSPAPIPIGPSSASRSRETDYLNYFTSKEKTTPAANIESWINEIPVGQYVVRRDMTPATALQLQQQQQQQSTRSQQAPTAPRNSYESSHLEIPALPMAFYDTQATDLRTQFAQDDAAFYNRDYALGDGAMYSSTPLQPEFPCEDASYVTVRDFINAAKTTKPNDDKERALATNIIGWQHYIHDLHSKKLQEQGLPVEIPPGGFEEPPDLRQKLVAVLHDPIGTGEIWDPFYEFAWWENGLNDDYCQQQLGLTYAGEDGGSYLYEDMFGNVTFGVYAAHPIRIWMTMFFQAKAPEKGTEIDKILTDNLHDPLAIEEKLIAKYGVEPTCPSYSEQYQFEYPPESGMYQEKKKKKGAEAEGGGDKDKKGKDKKSKKDKGGDDESAASGKEKK
eukprot:PhF_6_TR4872/c0_g1_i2/m.6847